MRAKWKYTMIQARIHKGRVEPQDPIPEAWEGQVVKIEPLTADDDIPNLEELIAAKHALGPREYDPGEREEIVRALHELNEYSKEAVKRMMREQR